MPRGSHLERDLVGTLRHGRRVLRLHGQPLPVAVGRIALPPAVGRRLGPRSGALCGHGGQSSPPLHAPFSGGPGPWYRLGRRTCPAWSTGRMIRGGGSRRGPDPSASARDGGRGTASFPKTFTSREFVRRGARTGPRGAAEDFGAWLTRLHDGERRADLMGYVAGRRHLDPLGGTWEDYRQMLTDVAAFTGPCRNLGWPTATLPAAGSGAAGRGCRVARGMGPEIGTKPLDQQLNHRSIENPR